MPTLTGGHEEGDPELSTEHSSPEVLQGAAIEGESAAHENI